MKIALIGNMNNNNFALMRYFRDMGADAHLLLYSNDGQATLSHFKPESDTWQIERWLPYIHQMEIVNGEFTIVGRKESQLIYLRPLAIAKSYIRKFFGQDDPGWQAPSADFIKRDLSGYDKYIGSGITPAVFNLIGMKLDIFYPYATGIEFYAAPEFVVKLDSINLATRISSKKIKNYQQLGIRQAKYRINSELSLTKESFDRIGVDFIKYTTPMVYLESISNINKINFKYFDLVDEIKNIDFTILSASRLFWVKRNNYGKDEWHVENKNNQKLIYAFEKFIKLRPHINARLYLFEYGPDVQNTKVLCRKLGIQSSVRWVPKMDRRDIMILLNSVNIASGEFYDVPKAMWGGTGWEALAAGKPLLQGFNFKHGEFESYYGYPEPPMLPIREHEDILVHLLDMADNPAKCKKIGLEALEWFHRYNGIGLAKKWLDLLCQPHCGQHDDSEMEGQFTGAH